MTMPQEGEVFMSMPEIAELARVQRPVISTWMRRHADFPRPAAVSGRRRLYDGRHVADWLVSTGRAEDASIGPVLRLYGLARLGDEMGAGALVPAVTALICLRHLNDDAPLCDGDGDVLERLRALAEELDPKDLFFRREIGELTDQRLPAIVDELVEAAWGCKDAFERIMEIRSRLGAAELVADRLDPTLMRLITRLADAANQADEWTGEVWLADPNVGSGDLLTGVAATLRDDQPIHIAACSSNPSAVRLARRRLAVWDLHEGDFTVHDGPVDPPAETDVIITHLPYQPAERRSVHEALSAVYDISLILPAGATAIVVAPADTVGALDPASEPGELRSDLIKAGAVKAIIRLPGGLVPYRPGYEVALWVLITDHDSRLHDAQVRGRVLLADVSDRRPTEGVIDALATDVLTWRRDGYDPKGHIRTHAVPALVEFLVNTPDPLSPRYLPATRGRRQDIPERVARALELESVLREYRPERPGPGASIAATLQQVPPQTATINDLIKGGRIRGNQLSLRKGTRLASDDVVPLRDATHDARSYRVIGPPELLGHSRVGNRRIDRLLFETRYGNAQRSRPGDVIITTAPEAAALVDDEGYSVIESPARILRVTERGAEHFTPRVLAALLTRPIRAESAVRPVQRLNQLRLPLLPMSEVNRLDRLLVELEERERLAHRELTALSELRQITTTGLTDGTLTLNDHIQ